MDSSACGLRVEAETGVVVVPVFVPVVGVVAGAGSGVDRTLDSESCEAERAPWKHILDRLLPLAGAVPTRAAHLFITHVAQRTYTHFTFHKSPIL